MIYNNYMKTNRASLLSTRVRKATMNEDFGEVYYIAGCVDGEEKLLSWSSNYPTRNDFSHMDTCLERYAENNYPSWKWER
jgi:hypothetical protein